MATGQEAVQALQQNAQGQAQVPDIQSLMGNIQKNMAATTQYQQPADEINAQNDVMQLALNKQRALAQAAGGPVDPTLMFNDLMENGPAYVDQATLQRNAVASNDYDAIYGFQQSGDPLLDVIINWEQPTYQPYTAVVDSGITV